MPRTMTAAVVHAPGGPEALHLETRPVPSPRAGEVLLRVKAFGLNRAEMFTRKGLSPDVRFPRILGIEAVGVVDEAPGGEIAPGTTVATCMGGLGRVRDGSYAEYACVPVENVKPFVSSLPWETLGALPEMVQTAYGSLTAALQLTPGDRLVIRGGTTSVGLAAAAIAKQHGAVVVATTRNRDRADVLHANGADHVLIDSGTIADRVHELFPGGVEKVLELVGMTTLLDSLRCVVRGGILCLTGFVGDTWTLDRFDPLAAIGSEVYFTRYGGSVERLMATPLQEFIARIEAGTMRAPIGRVFRLDEIVEAHRVMDDNTAGGKIVVLP